jgi:hypothetical protein
MKCNATLRPSMDSEDYCCVLDAGHHNLSWSSSTGTWTKAIIHRCGALDDPGGRINWTDSTPGATPHRDPEPEGVCNATLTMADDHVVACTEKVDHLLVHKNFSEEVTWTDDTWGADEHAEPPSPEYRLDGASLGWWTIRNRDGQVIVDFSKACHPDPERAAREEFQRLEDGYYDNERN